MAEKGNEQGKGVGRVLNTEMRQFSNNLIALRGFVDITEQFLSASAEERLSEHSDALAPLRLAMLRLNPEMCPEDDDREKLEEYCKERGIELAAKEGKESDPKSFNVQFSDSKTAASLRNALRAMSRMEYQTKHMYCSALISLVSSAEWFLSRLLHAHYKVHPKVVTDTDKCLSLQDLMNIGSLDDARDYIIATKVEEQLRGGFEVWVVSLKKLLKLSMGYLDALKPALVEVYQRRNLLVHCDGVVNTQYMTLVRESEREGVSVGDQLAVSHDYIDRAISTFERALLLIAAEYWKREVPEDALRPRALIDISYEHLAAERWDVAESLSRFMMTDARVSESMRLSGRLNYWQSLKWQGRFAEVEDEVAGTDMSAKDEIYVLAKAALLDDEKQFFELLPTLIRSHKIARDMLEDWPVFRAMRETEAYTQNYEGCDDVWPEDEDSGSDA